MFTISLIIYSVACKIAKPGYQINDIKELKEYDNEAYGTNEYRVKPSDKNGFKNGILGEKLTVATWITKSDQPI